MNKPLFVLLLSPILFLSSCGEPIKNGIEQPNIIFILTDDLGYGDIEPYGQQIIQTPNLSRLAKNGMLFTNAYCGTAVCAPSRAILMTGKHSGHSEIRGNREVEPEGQQPLSSEAITIAAVLKESGYTTKLIGKWGLGVEGTSGAPLKQGFDNYYGYLDQVRAHNNFPDHLLRNGEKELLENKPTFLSLRHWSKGRGSYTTVKKEYANDLFTKEAIHFIKEQKEKPFFLYLNYTTPHDNGEAPEENRIEVPDFGPYENQSEWTTNEKSYAAIITRLDQQIGEIIKQLDEKKLSEKTLILFTSDNGPEHYGMKRFDSNGPLRGLKRDLYEGGIRVPFIAYWPGRIKKGVTSNIPIAFWDFMPTAIELAGSKKTLELDGISFLPALTGRTQPQHPFLYFELIEQSVNKQAVRIGKWKALKLHTATGTLVELYDLENDIGEENNIADKHPEIIREAEQVFSQERTDDVKWPLKK